MILSKFRPLAQIKLLQIGPLLQHLRSIGIVTTQLKILALNK